MEKRRVEVWLPFTDEEGRVMNPPPKARTALSGEFAISKVFIWAEMNLRISLMVFLYQMWRENYLLLGNGGL
eukprot:15366871-Ditylum_brightwellii.AAC.1